MKRCNTANMNNIVNTVRTQHFILSLEQIWSWNPHCCDRLLWKLALVYASRVHQCHKMKSMIHLPEGCNYYNAFWTEEYWIWASVLLWRINTRYHGHTFTIFMCFQLLERRSIKSISKNLSRISKYLLRICTVHCLGKGLGKVVHRIHFCIWMHFI